MPTTFQQLQKQLMNRNDDPEIGPIVDLRLKLTKAQREIKRLTTEGSTILKYVRYARAAYERGDWDDVKEAIDDALSASGGRPYTADDESSGIGSDELGREHTPHCVSIKSDECYCNSETGTASADRGREQ